MTSDPLARYLSQRTAKIDRRIRLRIMTTSEVIDLAIRVYQSLGWTFLRATVGSSLFCLAALAFYFQYVLPSYFLTSNPTSESQQFLEVAIATALALFVAAPLFILGISYSSAVVTTLVSDFMVGNAPSLEAAQNTARESVVKLFLLNLREVLLASSGVVAGLLLMMVSGHLGNSSSQSDVVAGLTVLLAILAFTAGGVMFLVVISRHAVAPVTLVLEKLKVKEAAKRSAELLKRYAHHGSGYETVVTVYVLIGILFLILWGGLTLSLGAFDYPDNIRNWIANWPFSSFFIEALRLLPFFLVVWTLVPVWAVTMTVVYYERRIRLEGYDIEALAEDVWRADKSRRFEL